MSKRAEKDVLFPKTPLISTVPGMMPKPIITDPNGSYTGRPADPNERPIQDADDL